ncbi:DUF885 domain-containing protein [Mucilaginibacter sp. HMF5004]|uniref:DUF885 domain-containing protein n=1 Tax=Mucilaginibacter rivuli TaxID=2857527 RepID=UPI001C5FF24A|nr:DUF885 domain-containing protein [Mucilaginibacter rivuli]MBW4890837.1 DUF885 domain-containing protein [Mucilaginibacter rivuli]
MRKLLLLLSVVAVFQACKPKADAPPPANKELAKLFDSYFEGYLKLNPLTATSIGDKRYNDQLPNDGSQAYIKEASKFYNDYLGKINFFADINLNEQDKLSYDIFVYEMKINADYFKYHFEYLPFNQMFALPLTIGQFGSGSSAQPFKTVKDYDDWLKRLSAFALWADTAKANFSKGIKAGDALPKALVVKMIPQMESMVVTDPAKSLFYTPITTFPKYFSEADKKRLTEDYKKAIMTAVVPTYKGLGDYLKNEYLPHARTTSGFSAMPDGAAMYTYLVKQQTTTDKTPDEIYKLGLSEVARIRGEMDSIKNKVGFKGDMKAFFAYMQNDPKFMPYKTPKEVLAAFEDIHHRMEPNLKKMFTNVPKTPFEIRQTEAFRAASASAEYNQGSADGSRPGIFYVPILDATKFNTTSGMESLFLHEAIPGHHYQISLTQENTTLPKFRRFGGDNAYVEGWALYCESLGKELGLFADPYQHMGALGDEMHRAIRLVVDVAIHTKGMTREQAIKYMMDNEQISEQGATAEIERYMGIPGQALGYKIGALKIRELRNKAEKELGTKFSIAAFHNQILKDGSMPLAVLESKIDAWITSQK